MNPEATGNKGDPKVENPQDASGTLQGTAMGVSAGESQSTTLQRIAKKKKRLEHLKKDREERELNAKIEHEEALSAGCSTKLLLRSTDSRSTEEESHNQGK